jgi:hypothetical protein
MLIDRTHRSWAAGTLAALAAALVVVNDPWHCTQKESATAESRTAPR